MRKVYLHGKPLALDPRLFLGQGGEAEVYRAGADLAVKIFKDERHPDFADREPDQAAARLRLSLLGDRLACFPQRVPSRVVAPRDPVFDAAKNGRPVGFSMALVQPAEPLARLANRAFRAQGVSCAMVLAVFRDLARTLCALHREGVVVGDLNDQNVLVQGEEAFLIDADSFQFGRFPCTVFTPRFLDPRLLDPGSLAPVRMAPFDYGSDWYAFAVLLMQSLLYVGPYGGVYRPRRRSQAIPPEGRPAARISVFHPEVHYPRPAVPLAALPDPLLAYFREVFERDLREPFPLPLLESTRFRACPGCGLELGGTSCPVCATALPGLPVPVPPVAALVAGLRAVRTVFRTRGILLEASFQQGRLCALVHEDGAYRREDGQVLLRDGLDPRLEFRLHGEHTLVALGGELLCLRHGQVLWRRAVERVGNRHAIAANEGRAYFVDAGQLLRTGPLGPVVLGEVLSGQTRIWVDAHFGLGFYRAAGMWVAFLFDRERRGIIDSVALPPIRGKWLDTGCVFGDDRVGLVLAVQEGPVRWNHLVLVRRDGTVLAHARERAFEGGWLESPRGLGLWNDALWVATDHGLVRLAIHGEGLCPEQEFPETEPHVHAGCGLIPSSQGILVVDRQEVRLLTL